jgi:hypothetical protein
VSRGGPFWRGRRLPGDRFYVDACSGALVFGRDPLRLVGAVDQDY